MSGRCWTTALHRTGASTELVASWEALRVAVVNHQRILLENGIGRQVDERERIRVNAKRVGLEAPLFADEAESSFSDVLGRVMEHRQSTAATSSSSSAN